ncbi:MAG: type II toxin-antitoxin system RelB/DinJ family antitoxin [Endomicrobium sp.]|jgi:DNA-damage-inducible protein J|nr:type II toxin-antitoxin system RelB/DinJ family antitoxin [Endomicrobium sp.]
MAQINIRIDDTLKRDADNLFSEFGMNMTTAFNIFLRQSVRERKIPFEISAQAIQDNKQEKLLQFFNTWDKSDVQKILETIKERDNFSTGRDNAISGY